MEKKNNRIHQIDQKGRVAIPVNLRRELKFGERLILTKGIEKCIYIFTQDEWEKFIGRIKDFPMWDEDKRKAIRYILGESEEVEIDAQGRILIPGHLLAHAKLGFSCHFIKMPRWFEIWDPETYIKLHEPDSINFKEIPL
ncbi:MAG TPA: division/cell wall cluster transcriptional repressor MraZ [Candidatus Hydrothermia bacterium]|nr:division/cell wall cluster transcriptional repressor MraZ [Candidatus Hydrothermae bacterium]MDD3649437.1 division/cell wall cluster transcriptional repressor MraZ [Candidatus Hydrothermia bacterium]MDD5572815.1 division/cell wall cluster transcriptional repressor MraZ [Candidatus Hydrothermia bacterium]HOK22845.1 division/cell wall cluster transcriptional repressor MraZ [Candidatus Hydrothermia bacterium]HOL23554.1 division/cell wall cluster transcriptional repressor MraZ [Candidatus Hydrot